MAPLEQHPLRLRAPGQICSGRGGILWIADTGHDRVLGVDRSGCVHTVLGAGSVSDDAPALAHLGIGDARFRAPSALVLGANERDLFVVDSHSHMIWHVDLHARAARPIAGTGAAATGSSEPGSELPALRQPLAEPSALALDESTGALYIAMARDHRIWRMWLHTGTLSVLAGNGTRAHRDGPYENAAFAGPRGLALSPDRRRLYVADAGNAALRVLDLARFQVETLVSAGPDETAPDRRIQGCVAVSVSPGGLIIIDDRQHAIRGVNVLHGTVTPPLLGGHSRLLQPTGITFDREDKRILVSDAGNDRVLRMARDLSDADTLHCRVA